MSGAAVRPGQAHRFDCRLVWTGAVHGGTTSYRSFVREHRLEFDGKAALMASAAAAFRGDASLLNPEELLLAALVSCHFMSYAAQCAWGGVELVDYGDEASLELRPVDGVLRVAEAWLMPRAVVREASMAVRAQALHAAAHEGCFIARSVAFPVNVTPTIAVAGS